MGSSATITVIARRAFTLGGRAYAAGESLEVEPVDAAMLRYRQQVWLPSDRRRRQAPAIAAAPPAPVAGVDEQSLDHPAMSTRARRRAQRLARELRLAEQGADA